MRSEREERVWLAAEIGKRPAASSKLPDDVRRAAIAYTKRRVAQGGSQTAVARELAVTTMTVSRWLSMKTTPSKPVAKLKPVQVVDAPRSSSAAIVVTTADGARVEGLKLADIIALLRALR